MAYVCIIMYIMLNNYVINICIYNVMDNIPKVNKVNQLKIHRPKSLLAGGPKSYFDGNQ